MLSIKHLIVSYDNKVAVDDITVDFKATQISGLIGPNGAGKSTLMKTCIGIISAYSGEILFNTKSLGKNRFWVKRNAVYVAENAEMLSYLTGYEFLRLIAKIYNIEPFNDKVDFFIDLMGLENKKDNLIADYSHGMRQKLAVAAAFLPEPLFILLDESINGMDSISLARVFGYLKEQRERGRIILISSHNVELMEDWCEHIYVINKGKIVADIPDKELTILRNSKGALLKKYMEIIKQP